MKCKQCGNEFEAKRSTAKYCGAKCRKLAFSGDAPKVSVPPCKRLDVHCHACEENEDCSYLYNQTTAVPGDEDYVGICKEENGVFAI